MPEPKLESLDLSFVAKRLAELLAKPMPVTPSPLQEPITEPKTITVYVCPMIIEWNRLSVGGKDDPVRGKLDMQSQGQGQGFLAVFYTREEYDLVHPGFDPWVFKFTVMPNPNHKEDTNA